jgi:hypothetical protein
LIVGNIDYMLALTLAHGMAHPAPQVQNVLNGRAYPQHPAIMMADNSIRALEKDHLLELNGLRVPAAFDCDMFSECDRPSNYSFAPISRLCRR